MTELSAFRPYPGVYALSKVLEETMLTQFGTQYGLNWNAPLPKGGFALANDVKLIVELELAEQA